MRFGSGRGPGLHAHLFFALTVHNALIVAAVYAGRPGERMFGHALTALIVLATPLAGSLRLWTQDAYTSLKTSGRFFAFTLPAWVIVAPLLMPGRSVIPDGLVFYFITTVFLAMDVRPLRYHIAVSLLVFWFALAGPGAVGAPWILAVGATTIWCLSALHFAAVGEDFGLRGWWAVGRVLQTVAMFMIPSGGVAWMILWGWPVPTDIARPERGRSITPGEVWRRLGAMDPTDLAGLVRRVVFALIIVLLTLVVLYYLRRLTARRGAAGELPLIPGTDVSEVDYTPAQKRRPPPRLTGLRGVILREWWRWARRQRDHGASLRESDTAREFARAARGRSADPGGVDRLTELMERAHYGEAEPSIDEAEEMRRLTSR